MKKLKSFYHKVGLKQKFILAILITVIAVYIISFTYILESQRKININDALTISRREVLHNANKIESFLNYNMGVASGLVEVFRQYDQIPLSVRDSILSKSLYNALSSNPNYAGVFTSIQLSFSDKNWGEKPGRRSIVYFIDNNKIQREIKYKDVGGIKNLTSYHHVMKTKMASIANPYWSNYKGIKHLETTLSAPILVKNEFIGVVGIDIYLSQLKSQLEKIKPFGTGYAFLLSNNGIYVYHPDTTVIGDKSIDVNPDEEKIYNISPKIQKGESFEFDATLDGTKKKIIVFFSPIKVQGTTTPWSLGVLVRLDDVISESKKVIRDTIIVGLLGLIIILGILIFYSNKIFKSIKEISVFAEKLSNGDLNVKLESGNKDELGVMTSSLNIMSDRFRQMVLELKKSAKSISEFRESMEVISFGFNSMAINQRNNSEEVTKSVNEIAGKIGISVNNAVYSKEISGKAYQELELGITQANISTQTMKDIAKATIIISDITFLTNILALNAAIEASKAGVSGKSFGVIATEISRLADDSKKAAAKIEVLLQQGVTNSTDTGKIVNDLLPDMEKSLSLVSEIADLNEEQKFEIEKIKESVNKLNNFSHENESFAAVLLENVQVLDDLSKKLKEISDLFDV
jgi:methyl-accepting chemotaxis protein